VQFDWLRSERLPVFEFSIPIQKAAAEQKEKERATV
jgi:hypothetical protein